MYGRIELIFQTTNPIKTLLIPLKPQEMPLIPGFPGVFVKFPSFSTPERPAFSVESSSLGSVLPGRSTTAVRGERSSALRRRPVTSLKRWSGVVMEEL